MSSREGKFHGDLLPHPTPPDCVSTVDFLYCSSKSRVQSKNKSISTSTESCSWCFAGYFPLFCAAYAALCSAREYMPACSERNVSQEEVARVLLVSSTASTSRTMTVAGE